jgi:hypothetical protein
MPSRKGRKNKNLGVPQVLKDMRWVATRPPEADRTHGQRTQRELFEADKQRFMDKLTDLEKALLVGKNKAGAEPKEAPSKPSEQAEPPADAWVPTAADRSTAEVLKQMVADFKAWRAEQKQ